MSCIFCEIAAKRVASKIVHEDSQVVAFHDAHPQAPTHILVIPREHVRDLDATSVDHQPLLGRLLLVARDVAAKQGLARGYRVVMNRGADGGQSVDHLHVHVLGGRTLAWPPG